MAKLAILFDPSNSEGTRRMFNFCYNHRHAIKNKCEFWVGCSSSPYDAVNYWLKELRDVGFDERILFPGRSFHAFSGRYANHIFRPQLLNYTKLKAKLEIAMGKAWTSILYRGEPDFWDCGYLVLYGDTKVGRAIGAIDIDDEKAVRKSKIYVEKNPGCYGIYVESGSGSKRPVTERLPLLHNIRGLTHGKQLIVGGGIADVNNFEKALEIGADKIVVGTHFEDSPEDILNFASLTESYEKYALSGI